MLKDLLKAGERLAGGWSLMFGKSAIEMLHKELIVKFLLEILLKKTL